MVQQKTRWSDLPLIGVIWATHQVVLHHGMENISEQKTATPRKFNSLPLKKCWLEYEFLFGMVYFQGRTVKLPRE